MGEAMRYFPIFFDLKDRVVIVVGDGEEAARKLRLLSRTQARISVITDYDDNSLAGAALVVCADARLQARVSADARARDIPVNVVDRPDLSTFIMPSIVDRSPLVIAIGTEGTSPILGQGLRARLDAMLPQNLGKLADAANSLRARVAAKIPFGNRRRSFWQRFFFGDVRDAFIAGETTNYLDGVEALLATEATPPLGRVSFVSAGPGDPELLTLKAQRKLQEADVIVHDRFLDAAILEMARRDADRLSVGSLAFNGVIDILVRQAKAGRHVVRLRSGEALVEELAAVAAEGIPVETVPGIPLQQPAEIVTFPVREDIRDAILKAAS